MADFQHSFLSLLQLQTCFWVCSSISDVCRGRFHFDMKIWSKKKKVLVQKVKIIHHVIALLYLARPSKRTNQLLSQLSSPLSVWQNTISLLGFYSCSVYKCGFKNSYVEMFAIRSKYLIKVVQQLVRSCAAYMGNKLFLLSLASYKSVPFE